MHKFFASEWFNFEFLRLLSMAPTGGCEAAEALTAVSRIKDGNVESWASAWSECSRKAEMIAEEALRLGDKPAARAAYLRASNYARASQYMWSDRGNAPSPRLLPVAERYESLFRKGAMLFDDTEARFLKIPFEKTSELPAILYLPHSAHIHSNRRTPIIVNVNGGDSVQEELFFLAPSVGPRLGYAILTFDGPGQGMSLRRDKLFMRYDYEEVIKYVLDFLFEYSNEHPELQLDLDRIGILGASLGGYNALRAAIDPRIHSCVSIDPPYDMWEIVASKMPLWFLSGWLSGWISNNFIDRVVMLLAKANSQFSFEIGHMMWAFGQDTPSAALLSLRKFTLCSEEGELYLHGIQCPVLVSGAGGSLYFRPETSTVRILNELTNVDDTEKEKWIPVEPCDGGLQAKIGAFGLSNMKTFAFFDKHFKVEREQLAV
ncbi:uncharacterized protein EAF01_005014 [Botrytis porri]|uniref:uncharacterized protein n=1 Tax=Botrytis porri TaxID=87229 RepID=UPI001901ED0B|nr:uncharacterized protein EAF01_005014 [Botrytis porri]KAF7907428.1 hypothetical protein EAF01_005014 [Botrytis porri]